MKHRGSARFWAPDFVLFATTRTALGMGIGLLLARRLNNDQRKAAGISLAAMAALTTIPLGMRFVAMRRWRQEARERGDLGHDCNCGCPHCCPPEHHAEKAPAPAEGSAPAA